MLYKKILRLNKKKYFLKALLIIFIFLFLRLYNLGQLPIFNDEAMYLNWARLTIKNPLNNIFISLSDGQQPFYIWLITPFYWLFSNHFLLAGRSVSTLSGLGTLITLFFLGKELENKNIGILAMVFYTLSPFSLWYDRLAIKDSFLMFTASLILFLSLKQNETKSFKKAILLGIVLGISLLTKSIAYFFIFLSPLTIFLISASKKEFTNKENILKNLIKLFKKNIFSIVIILSTAFLIQSLLYLSPLNKDIASKNAVFLLSVNKILSFPINLWKNNLYSTIVWWQQFYSWPIIIAGLYGSLILFKKNWRLLAICSAWIGLPILFEVIAAKIYFPRYFLFTLIPFSLLISFGLDNLFKKIKKNQLLTLAIGLLLISPLTNFDYKIITQSQKAPLPQIEKWQYINGWPSGYGVKNLVTFLQKNYLDNKNVKLNIITEKETLLSSGLPLFLKNYSNWQIFRVDLSQTLPVPKNDHQTTLLIIYHQQQKKLVENQAKLIKKIPHGSLENDFLIYKL